MLIVHKLYWLKYYYYVITRRGELPKHVSSFHFFYFQTNNLLRDIQFQPLIMFVLSTPYSTIIYYYYYNGYYYLLLFIISLFWFLLFYHILPIKWKWDCENAIVNNCKIVMDWSRICNFGFWRKSKFWLNLHIAHIRIWYGESTYKICKMK